MTDDLSQDDVDQAFYDQMMTDCRRVFYCAPGHQEAVQEMIDSRGWTQLVELRVSPLIVDETTVYVVDENAIDAAMAKYAQKSRRL